MAVPTYDRFIEPILRYLAAHPDGAPAREVHDAAADALGLSDEDRGEVLPSGNQPVYKNRAGWAHDRLKRTGYSASLRRGFWRITSEGQAFAAANAAPLTPEVIEDLATRNVDVRLGPLPLTPTEEDNPVLLQASRTASPDDRLEQATR